MKRPIARTLSLSCFLLMLAFVAAVVAYGQSAPRSDVQAVRFESVDVFLDSFTHKLAAYQFELLAAGGHAEIVGLEGGEHKAFAHAPYYDPAALQGNRVIVAAYSVDAELPTGKTRVARIHMQITGAEVPEYQIKIMETLGPGGEKIAVTAESR